MKNLSVHKINFFSPSVKSIYCLSYNESSERLAVARSDFSVEIWDLKGKPFMEQVFKDIPSSVEALSWCNERLFSVGLDGCIIEYNLLSSCAKPAVYTGHGIWCIAAHKSLFAIGTEDGYVYIYRAINNELEFEKSFDKQEGRILCLAWHPSGNFIVTGSIDVIRVWDVQQGNICERINVGRKENDTETIVWCITVTSDMAIISGDSTGRTSFWDGKTGTLLNSWTTHKADVLSLCLSKDEKIIYTAGVDPVIVLHERIDRTSRSKWIKSVQRSIHTHDVRALVVAKDYLISGGVDSYLVFSRYPPKIVEEHSPLSEASYCEAAEEKCQILFQYSKCLEIWKFGGFPELGKDNRVIEFQNRPVKLLTLKSSETIVCSSISSDGKWVSYSTLSRMKLFYLNEGSKNEYQLSLQVKKINLPKEVKLAIQLKFLSSNKLVVASHGCLQILECMKDVPELLMSFKDFSSYGIIDTTVTAFNCCSQYIALGFREGLVLVFDIEKLTVFSQLPSYQFPPTALSFDSSFDCLMIAYSDRKVIKYDLHENICQDFFSFECMSKFQNCSNYPVRGIRVPKQDTSVIIMYDDSNIYVIDSSTMLEPESKHLKQEHQEGKKYQFSTVKSYKHILDMQQFCDGSILVVEMKPSKIRYILPAPLWKKQYGT